MKNTQGQWVALHQGVNLISDSGNHEVCTFINGIPVGICSVFQGSFSDSRPDLQSDPEYTISSSESLENARLIAAAPDLLAALEDAEFLLRKAAQVSGPMQDSFRRSAEDARSAISKARGEQ